MTVRTEYRGIDQCEVPMKAVPDLAMLCSCPVTRVRHSNDLEKIKDTVGNRVASGRTMPHLSPYLVLLRENSSELMGDMYSRMAAYE